MPSLGSGKADERINRDTSIIAYVKNGKRWFGNFWAVYRTLSLTRKTYCEGSWIPDNRRLLEKQLLSGNLGDLSSETHPFIHVFQVSLVKCSFSTICRRFFSPLLHQRRFDGFFIRHLRLFQGSSELFLGSLRPYLATVIRCYTVANVSVKHHHVRQVLPFQRFKGCRRPCYFPAALSSSRCSGVIV